MIILSNNQWKCDGNLPAWKERGEDCSAETRVVGLVRAYTEIMPDVLGLQEVSVHMAELMMQKLVAAAPYEYITGGDTPLVYRRDKYCLRESGMFRYTEHINGLVGSFNNAETKSYCYGVFEDRKTGDTFAAMSTHLWWMSSNPASKDYQPSSDVARAYQIRQAIAKLDDVSARYDCPVILMGDFNASVGSLCLRAATECGYTDVHDLSVGETDETCGHHPCFGWGYARNTAPTTYAEAIDHMMVKNDRSGTVLSFRRLTDAWFDPISDHYPLYAEWKF